MHRIVEPTGARSAIRRATAKVDPPDIPVKMPSFWASCLVQTMPSAPATGTTSSQDFASMASCSTAGMKSGVQPWIGCDSHAGWPPAGAPSAARCCGMPIPTSWALAGEVIDDLPGGRALMDFGVGLGLELSSEKPAVGLCQLDRLPVHADAFLGPRGQ